MHLPVILSANKKDLENFSKKDSRFDRLLLDEKRINAILTSIEKIKNQPDPLDGVIEKKVLTNGLLLEKTAVPFGVICVIYESRPNVTIDCASLAIKSGNAVILKGGKESYLTNRAFLKCIKTALRKCHFAKDSVVLLPPEKNLLEFTLKQDRFIDVVIPRGGRSLIQFVKQTSSIPCIETGAGVVHAYIDKTANIKMAASIIINAKLQRPSVCNALDFLLVHKDIAKKLFSELAKNPLFGKIELHADSKSLHFLKRLVPNSKIERLSAGDLGKEYLCPIMGIKIVSGIDQALEHIKKYSSKHSECIITNDKKNAKQFLKSVDAACVYHNASTRFTDGEEFGFGGEIGISTQKLHARGPMGLKALTTYKWTVLGNGQVR